MASKELKYISATFVNNNQFSMVCYLLHVHVQSKANGNLATILYTYMCTCILYMLSHTGNDGCTMNIHLLRHIVDCVRNWGPLWGYSCFSFESMNGHLKTHSWNTVNGFSGTDTSTYTMHMYMHVYICTYIHVHVHAFFYMWTFACSFPSHM